MRIVVSKKVRAPMERAQINLIECEHPLLRKSDTFLVKYAE